LALEYVECVDVDDLRTPARIDGPVLLAVAAMAGSTRLIDNLPLESATDGSDRT
jgi:pantothenate synthetase